MAAESARRVTKMQRILIALGNQAAEARKPDVAGDVPNPHSYTGPAEELKQVTALLVRDAVEIQFTFAAIFGFPQTPQRDCIALHDFADAVADRLPHCVT